MKHLKRIFESTEELDTEYIEMCFVDFIDQGGFTIKTGKISDGIIELLLHLPGTEYKYDHRAGWGWSIKTEKPIIFGDCLKNIRELGEFYENINTSIEKIKIRYPNIEAYSYTKAEADGNNPNRSYFDAYVKLVLKI